MHGQPVVNAESTLNQHFVTSTSRAPAVASMSSSPCLLQGPQAFDDDMQTKVGNSAPVIDRVGFGMCR